MHTQKLVKPLLSTSSRAHAKHIRKDKVGSIDSLILFAIFMVGIVGATYILTLL